MKNKSGKVFLVGAGPGDPGLITVKGRECIETADVLIYDFLASPLLLKSAGPDAEMIYVGKKGGDHTLPQEKINDLIVEKAREGKTVVRLKGGDPFIFGRGGEEAEILKASGVDFEIVPGVTSAIAAPAYAGIPLTHREFTSTVAFVTGHEDPTKSESNIDWEALARGIGTIVFLMGVRNLPVIRDRLIKGGMKPDTPVALVRWGTRPEQKTVTGTLSTIVDRVREAGLKAPAIIVVGGVVSLREKLGWFEKRPLLGKRIVVTRARAQASDFIRKLSHLGADCLEYPAIEIVPPEDLSPLDSAIDVVDSFDWIVFTSVNGVIRFFGRLFEKGLDARKLGNIRTAAIGPATAEALLSYGFRSDIVPETYRAESIVEAFSHEEMSEKKVLLPRAAEARPILPVELRNMGADVFEVASYRSIPAKTDSKVLIHDLSEKKIDMVTFTSSSTVKNFRSLLPEDDSECQKLIKDVIFAAIGPITADTAKKLGFPVHVEAEEYTIPGLCSAIVKFWEQGAE